MRILFISPGVLYDEKSSFISRGSESVIFGISKKLIEKKCEVYITGRFKNLGEIRSKEVNGINILNIHSPNIFDEKIHQLGSKLLYSKKVMKTITDVDPDVININESFSGYFPSKLSIPKSYTTHNPDSMLFYRKFAVKNNPLNHFLFPVKNYLEEKVMSRCDSIVALTPTIKKYLIERGFKNIHHIPNAIDIEKYHIGQDGRYILYAGRLSRVKGINYLIDAYELLDMNDEYKLVIIGSGEEENRLKKSVINKKLSDKVIFIPSINREALRYYLSNCSVFVFPSLFESFGLVMIEAMASGKTVIASDIPGPRDVISNGYDGFLFESKNVTQLKELLEMSLSDDKLRIKIGNNALKTIAASYTFQIIAEKYLALFDTLTK